MREPSSTKHIDGHIFHFFPQTTLLKSDANLIADRLRAKGAKVRLFHVYSSWNKRTQYEIFTFPKMKYTAGGK